MRIPGLKKYQVAGRGKFFEGLTPAQHAAAVGWLRIFKDRRRARGLPLQSWLQGIYYGQAKRLALNPPTSAWGRSMRAKKGGYAVQIKYRCEARNPTAKATYVRTHGKTDAITPVPPTVVRPTVANLGFPPPHQPVTIYRGRALPGRW